MNDLVYGEKSLRELGFAIKHYPIHSVAKRDIELQKISGRNGDLIISNGGYLNVDMPPYEINTIDLQYFPDKSLVEQTLISWLMTGEPEYKTLIDSTKPGFFTKAICTEIGEINTNNLLGYLSTTLYFNRVPFWYSYEGQRVKMLYADPDGYENSFYAPDYVTNDCLPCFKVKNTTSSAISATININDTVIVAQLAANDYIEFDSETQETYKGSTNRSGDVQCGYLPILKPGKNTYQITVGCEIELIPRWCCL